MGRYYTEPEAEKEAKIFNITSDTIRQVQKDKKFKRTRGQALKYVKGEEAGARVQELREIKKRKKVEKDPFPGRKPVDPVKIEENSRGEKVDVKKVKTKFKQKGESIFRILTRFTRIRIRNKILFFPRLKRQI